jgi:hypothetical protein
MIALGHTCQNISAPALLKTIPRSKNGRNKHVYEDHDNELGNLIRKLSIQTDWNTYSKEIIIHPVYQASCWNPTQHIAQLNPFTTVPFDHTPPDWDKQGHESSQYVREKRRSRVQGKHHQEKKSSVRKVSSLVPSICLH